MQVSLPRNQLICMYADLYFCHSESSLFHSYFKFDECFFIYRKSFSISSINESASIASCETLLSEHCRQPYRFQLLPL